MFGVPFISSLSHFKIFIFDYTFILSLLSILFVSNMIECVYKNENFVLFNILGFFFNEFVKIWWTLMVKLLIKIHYKKNMIENR